MRLANRCLGVSRGELTKAEHFANLIKVFEIFSEIEIIIYLYSYLSAGKLNLKRSARFHPDTTSPIEGRG